MDETFYTVLVDFFNISQNILAFVVLHFDITCSWCSLRADSFHVY